MYKIALDGPSGSGKSVMARAVAKELNILYVDTGALYRAIGLYMFRNDIDPANTELVIENLDKINIELAQSEEGQVVFLNGENVNKDIRLPEISMYASKVQIVCGNSKCEKYNKGTRIKHEIVDGKKIRVCAKCGKEL